MNINSWLKNNTERLDGRTVAITGATGGLGSALCRYLLLLGASLILLDRNCEKSNTLRTALLSEHPQADIRQIPLDLEDLESVKAACKVLETMQLDVLIHNAGAYSIPHRKCDTGYDNVFQINFVSPYYMTRRLLPHLRACRGHVVAVGSIAHTYAKSDANDIDFSTRKRASLIYGNAKRYLMFSMMALFRDETRATLSVTHPGISFTGITAHYPPWLFAIIKRPMKIIFMRPRTACLSILRGVFAPTEKCEWWGPRLFSVWGKPVCKRLHTCSKQERRAIAERAEKIYRKISDN